VIPYLITHARSIKYETCKEDWHLCAWESITDWRELCVLGKPEGIGRFRLVPTKNSVLIEAIGLGSANGLLQAVVTQGVGLIGRLCTGPYNKGSWALFC
jgi:hypothetical protein